MPDYSQRPGGALFAKDAKKKTNPNQPDFDGYVVLDPAEMSAIMELWKRGEPVRLDLAGWRKRSDRTGTDFLSISAKLPRAKKEGGFQRQPQPAPQQRTPFDDDDDEIPF